MFEHNLHIYCTGGTANTCRWLGAVNSVSDNIRHSDVAQCDCTEIALLNIIKVTDIDRSYLSPFH